MTYIINYFLPYSTCFPRLTAADGLFLFGVKKTSAASLNAVENIKAHEKTKNTG
ncbi:hypothetical protein QF042_002349 [Pedobacter sp. W3I1]|nr:hypothetical protein [Pedobacter sp. W3I1]